MPQHARLARLGALVLLLAGPLSARAADEPIAVLGSQVRSTQPDRIARSEALLGAADSYRTGMTVRRVLAEGTDYTYTGKLVASPSNPGPLSCPYQLAGQPETCLLGTELLEHLDQKGPVREELKLEGRILEVDGIRCIVLTAYQPGKA
jgi:hypothetical protein